MIGLLHKSSSSNLFLLLIIRVIDFINYLSSNKIICEQKSAKCNEWGRVCEQISLKSNNQVIFEAEKMPGLRAKWAKN